MSREIYRNTNPKTEWNRGAIVAAALALALTGGALMMYRSASTRAEAAPTDTKPLEGPTRTTPYFELTRVKGDFYKAGSGTKHFDSDQLIIDLKERGCTVDLQPYPASGVTLRTYLIISNCDPFQ